MAWFGLSMANCPMQTICLTKSIKIKIYIFDTGVFPFWVLVSQLSIADGNRTTPEWRLHVSIQSNPEKNMRYLWWSVHARTTISLVSYLFSWRMEYEWRSHKTEWVTRLERNEKFQLDFQILPVSTLVSFWWHHHDDICALRAHY